MTEAERFWAKVDTSGDCWIWTGSITQYGYGYFHVHRDGRWRKVAAHRWAYQQLVGPIPDGLQLDHVKANGCTAKTCVKAVADSHGPPHLEAVTQRENILRGDSPNIITHRTGYCHRGHSMHDAYIAPRGHRECRPCRREATRQCKARQSARALQP